MTLDEIAAEIGALTGGATRHRAWLIARNSQEDCSCCGRCAEPIKPGEPVWRIYVTVPGLFSPWRSMLAALCAKCGKQDWHAACCEPKPCKGCGRTVHSILRVRWSERACRYFLTKPVVCCEECGHQARLAKQRRKRTRARGTRDCPVCHETFEPTRTDAKFCSSACRQKAYRERVTDAGWCYTTTALAVTTA